MVHVTRTYPLQPLQHPNIIVDTCTATCPHTPLDDPCIFRKGVPLLSNSAQVPRTVHQ